MRSKQQCLGKSDPFNVHPIILPPDERILFLTRRSSAASVVESATSDPQTYPTSASSVPPGERSQDPWSNTGPKYVVRDSIRALWRVLICVRHRFGPPSILRLPSPLNHHPQP